jgi:hypothetical protein
MHTCPVCMHGIHVLVPRRAKNTRACRHLTTSSSYERCSTWLANQAARSGAPHGTPGTPTWGCAFESQS